MDNKSIKELIQSDYYRYTTKKKNLFYLSLYALSGINRGFTFTFWLRLASKKTALYPLFRVVSYLIGRSYGVQINPKVKIGCGLYIAHANGIIINPNTVIGNNCNLSQFTTIGSTHSKAAKIGDNIYIGPSVCIVGDVKIGNNSVIGAGSVVVKDVPEGVTFAGNPARQISSNPSIKILGSRWN